jgi:hypothetical protein
VLENRIFALNIKKGIATTIFLAVANFTFVYLIALIIGFLPLIINISLGNVDLIFNTDLIIRNGIILTIVGGLWAFLRRGCLLKVIFYGILIGIIIWFYFIGSNILTLFLPHIDNQFCSIFVLTDSFSFRLNYLGTGIFIIAIFGMFMFKSLFDYIQNEEKLPKGWTEV